MSANQSYAGTASREAGNSDWNQTEFMIRSVLNKIATATLVRVEAVSGQAVDIKPLVAQLDGAGNAVPHGVIHNVPVWRVQAGSAAIVIDPVVGDIGLAVFAHNDISSAKKNKGPSTPGSRRRFDWADAIYMGGLLNGDPTQFLRFKNGAIDLVGNGTLTINAGSGSIRLVSDMTGTSGALAAGNGATGTFVSQDNKTVTVTNGIITKIAV